MIFCSRPGQIDPPMSPSIKGNRAVCEPAEPDVTGVYQEESVSARGVRPALEFSFLKNG